MADGDWASDITKQEGELATKVGGLNIANGQGENANTANAAPAAAAPAAAGDEEDTKVNKAEQSLLRKELRQNLVTTKADLDILQSDPNSPLYSVRSFEALHLKPELLKGVYAMGFNAPSKIQETALPTLLADPPQNMIAQSQSGTGKTAAFVLTMLSRADASLNYPQCLCLAPTYELALQIGEVTKKMASLMTGMSIRYGVRGERVGRGEKLTDQIIIGTPGTLLDWSMKFRCFDLKKIKVFVLDEADVMIDTQGHQDQSIRIQRNLSKECQMLLFSATYDAGVMKFAEAIVPDPITIKLRREEESLDNIKQVFFQCQNKEDKLKVLSDIYGSITIGQSMIFCHTRKTASWLSEEMSKAGHAVALLSGELTVEMRAAVIKRFREGKEKVLITTNVSARGIDVEQVTVVVNFDLPVAQDGSPDCETYLHRIGRTGRFGKKGLAINMVDGNRSYKVMQAFEQHFGRSIEPVDKEDFDAIEKLGEGT